MRMLAVCMMLGLALVVFGASDAKAVCIDFSSFCDCLTLNPAPDAVGATGLTRLFGTWENQDCAGTTSTLQGMLRSGAASAAGEPNSILGFDGISFNITISGASSVFDLDEWDGVTLSKIQDESPYTLLAGACVPGCFPPIKAGKPASMQR